MDASPAAVSGPVDAAGTVAGRVLAGPARLGPVRLLAVDGPAGSGKTTFAARVADAVRTAGARATVLGLDDLYDGWAGLDGTLWPRLRAQVLEPLRRGRAARYQRYDWAAGRLAGWVDLDVPDVLVLEGCGSARRAVDALATLTVWVEADDDVRLARGLARDGAHERSHWLAWMALERAHFAREGTRGRADVRLDAFGMMTT